MKYKGDFTKWNLLRDFTSAQFFFDGRKISVPDRKMFALIKLCQSSHPGNYRRQLANNAWLTYCDKTKRYQR